MRSALITLTFCTFLASAAISAPIASHADEELLVKSVTFSMEGGASASSSKHGLTKQADKTLARSAPSAEILEFETSGPVSPKTFTLDNPPRVVIDLPSFRWKVPPEQLRAYKGSLIRQLRYARHSDNVSRIVLDLGQAVAPSILSGPNSTHHKVRLAPNGAAAAPAPVATAPEKQQPTAATTLSMSAPIAANSGYPVPVGKPGKSGTLAKTAPAASATEKRIIVIDAGHGGQDPGAIGPHGTQEKGITLAFARALKERLDATGRYKGVLTRDKDFFIPLRQRVNIARQNKGNLFVSLHADSAPGAEARGLSVYSLSETASDAEAAKLASKENKADIINGVDLSGASKDVTDILIDLAQRNTMTNSEHLGTKLLGGIQAAGVYTLQKPHRHAGFAVLKAPDIPSVLVELGFVSHPEEERLLQESAHRAEIVDGIVKGIDSYFAQTTTEQ